MTDDTHSSVPSVQQITDQSAWLMRAIEFADRMGNPPFNVCPHAYVEHIHGKIPFGVRTCQRCGTPDFDHLARAVTRLLNGEPAEDRRGPAYHGPIEIDGKPIPEWQRKLLAYVVRPREQRNPYDDLRAAAERLRDNPRQRASDETAWDHPRSVTERLKQRLAVTDRIREAAASSPERRDDKEADTRRRMILIGAGRTQPSSLDLALISEATGATVEYLLAGNVPRAVTSGMACTARTVNLTEPTGGCRPLDTEDPCRTP